MAGLYIHIPFRRDAHAYDDSFGVDPSTTDEAQFVAALRRELQMYGENYLSEEPLRTVYLGGGTPSLLSLQSIHDLLDALRTAVDVSALEEITMELTPSTVSADYLQGLRQMGVDRLSIEALSFSNEDLRALDAPHTAEAVATCLREARATGVTNLSVDLFFGWPEQSHTDWTAALKRAADLDLPHLTLLEAPSQAGPVASDKALAHRLKHAMTMLRSEGYEQYELTHFARPGARSRHQENYYAHGNQLGLGPSAESFWWPRRPDRGHARRWSNVSDVDRYIALLRDRFPPIAFRQTLDRRALAQEYVMLRLRTEGGLDLDHLAQQYGVDLRAEQARLLDRLQDEHLIRAVDHRIRLTVRGRLVTDGITETLMPAR